LLLHKKTHTYIKEITEEDVIFGEIAFFSVKNRKATARTKTFTEVMVLDREDFENRAKDFPESLALY